MAFSMAAEIEHDLISARNREALRARKASGLPLGRPKGPGKSKLDPYRPEIEALLANGSTQKFREVLRHDARKPLKLAQEERSREAPAASFRRDRLRRGGIPRRGPFGRLASAGRCSLAPFTGDCPRISG
ncbi:MAG: hypothetical protein OXI87_04960 [Albidovulum sp.]|nr:hypothetical protein [Albidovulum sp.]